MRNVLFFLVFQFSLWLPPLPLLGSSGLAPFSPDAVDTPADVRPQDVIRWQEAEATRYSNGYVVLALRLQTFQGFSLYAHNLRFEDAAGIPLQVLRTPNIQEIQDPLSDTGKTAQIYTGGDFELWIQLPSEDTSSEFTLRIHSAGCTNRLCLPPYTQELHFSLHPKAEAFTPPGIAPAPVISLASLRSALQVGAQDTDELLRTHAWWWLAILLFLGGLFTNLTPCVYPMIPITIGLLSQQKNASLLAGLAYGAGIVLIYTSLALFTAWTGGLFGQFMATPGVNLAFASLMFLIACSMLGYGNWHRLQSIGFRFQHSRHGLINACLLGMGAGFVAAPCTGPILAALLTYTATSGHPLRACGFMLIYSIGFALPYVALAKAAHLSKKIKFPAHFDHAVKVIFASTMLGLGWYYLRVPFYMTFKTLQPYWSEIGLATLFIAAILWNFQHLSKRTHIRGYSLLLSLCLSLSLFSGFTWWRSPTEGAIEWYMDEATAFSHAQERKAPVLIDLWAEWCEACKKMDAHTFSDPQVQVALQKWVLLKIDLTEDTPENEELLAKYHSPGLPTLLLLPNAAIPEQHTRITGYTEAKELIHKLQEAQRSSDSRPPR